MLDLYECKVGTCDDLELHYRFLEELVPRLKMEQMTTPIVVHCPMNIKVFHDTDYPTVVAKYEKYPDKAGVSGWIGLTSSGIQIHSIEWSHFSTIDIYTCGKLEQPEIDKAILFIKEIFGCKKVDYKVVDRGLLYG